MNSNYYLIDPEKMQTTFKQWNDSVTSLGRNMDQTFRESDIMRQNQEKALIEQKINILKQQISKLANKEHVEALTAEVIALADKSDFTMGSFDVLEAKVAKLVQSQTESGTISQEKVITEGAISATTAATRSSCSSASYESQLSGENSGEGHTEFQ